MLNSIRLFTTAYLFHEDTVLLLRRSMDKPLAPGVWSGVGGHIEADEYGDLRASCLREIHEETGLTPPEIDELELRYIILRQGKDELRQQFVYFGTTNTNRIGTTEEGTLHWVPLNDALTVGMTESNHLMLEHFFQNKQAQGVIVGTMFDDGSKPAIRWSTISDWQ